ncbi:MAG: TlpA family protein disulfide reductase [Paludibacterium sp.]|uniref:TlpA disulfide reductase family protein n=1 Tax=Paludibacterium sp. TaxID=1917523 RepID=UPI0025FF3270|nr:TlpA disulfide reductase family protein [Paludibacterium sp.]MBV8046888.1 TlpA family protein disulfide reductase [Paludibacterium sp.]MBV8648352.1 TlpA family protein disulfide reductase [Paludibacterium sp.]
MRSKLWRLFWAGLLLCQCAPAWPSTLRVGQDAPPLAVRVLDGTTLNTRDLKGKVVILAFWATWCDACRDELPLLSDYAHAHAKQGLVVLGISLDDSADLARVQTVAKRLDFPVGLLGSAWAGGYGRIWRLPVSFVIDRQGRLADNGWDSATPIWTKERLDKVVLPLLTPQP